MLKEYIKGTRKKFVATTLALSITFSAVVIPPISHSYDSALLQANAIETEDELQDLIDEREALMEELQEIEQKEAAGVSDAKGRVKDALSDFKKDVDKAYRNESIDDIYSAIRSLEWGPMWVTRGEVSQTGSSIYQTFVDIFTDNAKDLLDEIFDSASELEEDAFEKSKEIIEGVINNLCDNMERMADLTAEVIDPQNRKAEIKNRIKEIELQINKIGSQEEGDDTSLEKLLANKFYEADNKHNAIEDECNTARDKWYKLLDEHKEAIKPAETKWETALKNYENAAKNYQTITLNLSDDEYKIILDTLLDATNKVDEARNEYFNAKAAADDKYNADIATAKSEYMKLEKECSEFDEIMYKIESYLDIGIITHTDLRRAFLALGYSDDDLYDLLGFWLDSDDELDELG